MLSKLLSSYLFFTCVFSCMNSLESAANKPITRTAVTWNDSEQQALLAIKDLILEDPSNVLRTWNTSAHFCKWQGVTCGPWHQRVVSLNLASLSLWGSLSPQVGRLTFLRTINLCNNSFRGQIPQEIGQLFRLQHLVLSNNFFEGELPISLAQCTEIRSIRLSHNRLRGNIPTDLSSWSKLRVLDLSANHFNRTIPVLGTRQLWERNNAPPLFVSPAKGNTRTSTPEAKAPSSSFPYVVILIVNIFLFFMSIACVSYVFCRNMKSKEKTKTASPEDNHYQTASPEDNHYLKVSYAELVQATSGFSSANLIGKGSFGFVYKGILNNNGHLVAIKVLNLKKAGAIRSFIAECKASRNVRHRNLLKIITLCSGIDSQGNDFKALVYEFMPNGNLESWLYPTSRDKKHLNLLQRLNIAIDIASALVYLHHHSETPIAHCDLKPGNVLLDDNLSAHLGDFGLARFLVSTKCKSYIESSTMALQGTVGYVAPEYGMGAQASTHGDVYSFGILLIEMFVGKRPTDVMFTDNLNIQQFTKMAHPDRVLDIMDSQLRLEMERLCIQHEFCKMTECMVWILEIGIKCTAEQPRVRMDIGAVLKGLHIIINVILECKRKRERYGGEGM